MKDHGVVVAKNEATYDYLVEKAASIGKVVKKKNQDGVLEETHVPGVDGKKIRAWPARDKTALLRLMYPQSTIDRNQSIDFIFRKSLYKSGITKDNPVPILDGVTNEELEKMGEAFYMDPFQPLVLVFKAKPALVQAIMTDRNNEKQPHGCNVGCLTAGCYVQPVFYGKNILSKDSELDFGFHYLAPKARKPKDRS